MLSRQMTKVIDTIKTAFDSGKILFRRVFYWYKCFFNWYMYLAKWNLVY